MRTRSKDRVSVGLRRTRARRAVSSAAYSVSRAIWRPRSPPILMRSSDADRHRHPRCPFSWPPPTACACSDSATGTRREASGGAERAAWEMYRRLGGGREADVRVVSAAHGRPHVDPGVDVRRRPGLDLTRARRRLCRAGARRISRRLDERSDHHRPQVLHANTIHYTGACRGGLAPARSGVPLVVTAQLGTLEHLPRRARLPGNAYERTSAATSSASGAGARRVGGGARLTRSSLVPPRARLGSRRTGSTTIASASAARSSEDPRR